MAAVSMAEKSWPNWNLAGGESPLSSWYCIHVWKDVAQLRPTVPSAFQIPLAAFPPLKSGSSLNRADFVLQMIFLCAFAPWRQAPSTPISTQRNRGEKRRWIWITSPGSAHKKSKEPEKSWPPALRGREGTILAVARWRLPATGTTL